jgi:tRNA(Ile)-lysidine synthase
MANFRCDLIPAGGKVLCALSGGADSMYLLCRLREAGYEAHAAHYNHRLRATADRDEQFVRNWCKEHSIPLSVGSGDVAQFAAEHGLGIEEAARKLRYDFLYGTAAQTGCTLIATGHHAGDNAETVLMNLIRGCGLNGLCGIPERRGILVRPMLSITRQEIISFLTARSIPWVEDESNLDQSYSRNRIRHQLLPLLEEMNPQAIRHITEAAARLGEDEKELVRQAEALLTQFEEGEEGLSVPLSVLNSAPRPISLRALRMAAPEAQAVHLEAMLDLCRVADPSAQLDFPGGTVRRVYDALLFTEAQESAPMPAPLSVGAQTWGSWHISCSPATCPQKAYIDPTHFFLREQPYRLRSRQEGDEIRLGKRPCKTVKKLMIEGRIPRHLRAYIPVLADHHDHPAAVGGFGPHRDALAEPGTPCLEITIRKGE